MQASVPFPYKKRKKLLLKSFPVPSYTHFLLTDAPMCPKHSPKRGFCVFHLSISSNTIFSANMAIAAGCPTRGPLLTL